MRMWLPTARRENSRVTLGLNYTYIWLSEDARIDHVRVSSIRLHRGFLQGDIANSAGASSGQWHQ